MDKRRIKAIIMLSMMTTMLSSCSKEDFISRNYKIIKEYDLEDEDDNEFHLVQVDNNILGNSNYKIIGSFETVEKAREYISQLMEDKDDLKDDAIVFVVVGGMLGYFIWNAKRKEKTKKLEKK